MEARGYCGAGLNEVIEGGKAPGGSLYHHFPGGKDQLIDAEDLACSLLALIEGALVLARARRSGANPRSRCRGQPH